MSEHEVVEVEVVETPEPEEEAAVEGEAEESCESEAQGEASDAGPAEKSTSASLKDAWKQVESFGQALSEALQGRGNVVMVRVNDEALEHLDMLVDADITKSRSESAAFLINEGITANQELFARISKITQQIAELRDQLREEVKQGLEPEA